MTDLVVETWDIGRLRLYEGNPRLNDPHVPKMIEAIKEYGFRIPIVAKSDGVIIDGHLRYKAARKMGLQTVPVALADDLTEAQVRAFRLMANKSVSWATWDDDLLRFEFSELKAAGFDLALTGFGDEELAALFASPTTGNTDPDDVPELQPNPVSELGDVWLLGNHRLACGDSTDADTVAKALNGVKPHLMVTDPPYGVEYDPGWRDKAGASGTLQRISRNRGVGTVSNDDRADWSEAWALFPGDVAYVWHGALQTSAVLNSLEANGLLGRSLIVWVKQHFAIGRGDYHNQHEPCWYVVRKSKTGHYCGDRKQSTVWNIKAQFGYESSRKDNVDKASGHSAQKPVECMKRPIENNSSPGQAVYEPFAGSSTTVIACEMTGRVCHAIELSPNYCDVGLRRWQAFTGRTATLESDGRTFAEVEAGKAPQTEQAAE